MESQVFRGNLGAELELSETSKGTPVVKFRLACNDRYQVAGEWKDAETVWINVEAWRQLALNAKESLPAGAPVVVVGKWKASVYKKDGETRRAQYIVADSIAVDLAYSTTTGVQRTKRGETPAVQGEAPAAQKKTGRPKPLTRSKKTDIRYEPMAPMPFIPGSVSDHMREGIAA